MVKRVAGIYWGGGARGASSVFLITKMFGCYVCLGRRARDG